ncbi:HNH endonuclease signature motif containing protein [Metabacillus fastidiosus]|uniref:HNH endonuclease signature motif containing protein n=1 Tax=Metabacillus fastidiosus TaxID=1458 RepID=UPI002E23A894|nr:HNH endonuclease signature motif containing protein [Metabacillus fastidiosus]
MYLIEFPNYTLEDFFDEMLTTRQGEAYNFLKGRLLAIKSTLVEKEEEYIKLASPKNQGGLFDIVENIKIEIPKTKTLGEIINLPSKISKRELIEFIKMKKIDPLFNNLEEMEVNEIKTFLNSINLNTVIKQLGDPNLIYYLSYVDAEAMKNAYEKYLVNTKGSSNIGRKVYGDIMSLSKDNLCPYCLQGIVKTVDHYLPKAYFIDYSITPINLLPCCSDCNKNKNDERTLQEDKMFINPYFDNIQNVRWLGCKVNEVWPITFSYYVREDIGDVILKERLKIHFDKLELGFLYANKAVTYFRGRVKEIVKEYNSSNYLPPIDSLKNSKESIENYNLNSWEAKIYEALLDSKWFLHTAIKELESKYDIPKEEKKFKRPLYEAYFG